MLIRHLKVFMASRGGCSSPWGKLTEWVEAFRVEPAVKAAFARKAAAMNPPMTSAELLRECMRVVAYGPDEVKRMRGRSVDQVARLLGGMSHQ